MANYVIPFEIRCYVQIAVEADDEADAIELAEEQLQKISNYCGNDSCEKLIGLPWDVNGSIHDTGIYELDEAGIEIDG